MGVRGPISRAKRNFIKPRSGIRDCVGVGPRGRISRRPDNLKAGRRVQAKGGKTISRSASSTFHLPPYTQAKRQGCKVLERMVLKMVLDEVGGVENAKKKRNDDLTHRFYKKKCKKICFHEKTLVKK